MALIGKRECDICKNEIPGKNYLEMQLKDMRIDTVTHNDEICLVCHDKIRSFIRHGLPKFEKK
jgi:hypothetical protein